MQHEQDIWSLAYKGLGKSFRIILICSALSAAVSTYADWTDAALSVSLIPDLLFSALIEFALFNAMLGYPVMGGAGGGGKFNRFLMVYMLISGLPVLAGVLYGLLFASLETGLLMVSVPLSILSYSLLGMSFPAIMEGEPGNLTEAYQRGRRQIGFVLPRILGVTVAIYAVAILLFMGFSLISGAVVMADLQGKFTTTGVVFEFSFQILGNTIWAIAVAVLVAAYLRESPSRIFE